MRLNAPCALRELRLSGIRATLDTRILQAQATQQPFLETFSLILQDELDRRRSRLTERRYHQSALDERATLPCYPRKNVRLLSNQSDVFTPLDFENVVKGLSLTPRVLTRCPDQWVGNVECQHMGFVYLGDSNQDFLTRLSLDEAATSLPSKRIILVLESPHIDEFASCLESEDPMPIGQGRAGFLQQIEQISYRGNFNN